MGIEARARGVLRTAAREVSRLVIPVQCPGCGEPDVRWCARCAKAFHHPPERMEHLIPRLDLGHGAPVLPVWSLTPYSGTTRPMIVAWKDRGRADLDDLVSPAIHRACTHLAPLMRAALRGVGEEGLTVVTAPSSEQSRRVRARDHLAPLARAATAALRHQGINTHHRPLLTRARGRDLSGLGATARTGSVDLKVSQRHRRRIGTGGSPIALILDDVVTTGTTLKSMASCLSDVGIEALGALTLAATPPPE